MEKKLDQDHRLLAEKLDNFEVTDFSKDEVWGDISTRVFEKKEKKKFWWWYAVAAVFLLVGTFFLIPDQELTVADANTIPQQSRGRGLKPVIDENPVASTIELETSSENEETKAKRRIENIQPAIERAISMAPVSQKKSMGAEKIINETVIQNPEIEESVTEMVITEPKANSAAKNTEDLHSQKQANEPKPVLNVPELSQPLLASNSEKMEGKKLVLIIEDLDEGSTNKKDNLFRKIGKFNRTGEWEKTEKERGIWARFIESTKPDQKAIQL